MGLHFSIQDTDSYTSTLAEYMNQTEKELNATQEQSQHSVVDPPGGVSDFDVPHMPTCIDTDNPVFICPKMKPHSDILLHGCSTRNVLHFWQTF